MFDYLLRSVLQRLDTLVELQKTSNQQQAATNALLSELNAHVLAIGAVVGEIHKDTTYLCEGMAVLLLPIPGEMVPVLLREENGMLVYKAQLPVNPASQGDIVTKRFTVNGGAATDLPFEATESPEFSVEEDTEVTLSLTHVDNKGNESAAKTQTFTAHDTIAPDAPGDFQEITLIREEV